MKRVLTFVLAIIMLLGLSAFAFAEGEGSSYTLYMDRNGKVVTDASGSKVYGRVQEKIFQKFYKLMKGVPVNWDRFDYSQYDVTVGADGTVTFGSQVMAANDGSSVTSDNAEVVIFETPSSFHAASTGNAVLNQCSFDGEIIGTSNATVKALSNGSCIISNICGKCGEDQGSTFHLMVCGHFSCEVGTAGHGAGSCGIAGHMNCDGKDHSVCSNCLKPKCSGEHGVGICQHVHTWQRWDAGFAPNGQWIVRYYCPGCNTFDFRADELPPIPPAPLKPHPEPAEKKPE